MFPHEGTSANYIFSPAVHSKNMKKHPDSKIYGTKIDSFFHFHFHFVKLVDKPSS